MSRTMPRPEAVALEDVPCDLCGSTEHRVRYRKPDAWARTTDYLFPVVECASCGLVYVNPRPTKEAMGLFYPPGYHRRSGEEHQDRYALQARRLPDLDGKRLLDVGCAEGDFLRFLRGRWPGAELCGADYYAPETSVEGVELFGGSLLENTFDEESFDIVTAWAVFEHLHEPKAHFRAVQRLLKPGGRFIFLVTNADSLYGRCAYSEDVPRHLYHFSPRTLRAYGASTGFEMESLEFDDSIFDGRGRGTFWYLFTAAAGADWDAWLTSRFTLIQRAAARAGNLLDRVVFSTHWERRLRRSGIMIATLRKAERGL